MLWKKTAQKTQNNDITLDLTEYVSVVANDPFSPGHVCRVGIDPKSVTSAQLMGYGTLDDAKVPIVRLTYNNGLTEDVFDVEQIWSQ